MPNQLIATANTLQIAQAANAARGMVTESPQQTIARLRIELQTQGAENTRLRQALNLRDHALDSASMQFTICKIADPVSIIVYCNQALAKHHGYRREELIGVPITKLAAPGWTVADHKKLRAKIEAGEIVRFEKEAQRKDGSMFIRGATIVPLTDNNGAVTHSLSISADITNRVASERKQRELQEQLLTGMKQREHIAIELRLAQRLESVGRLAAGVAHEINTPIQFVSDSLYFLRGAFDDLANLLNTCRSTAGELPANENTQLFLQAVDKAIAAADLSFLEEEIPKAFERTFDGANLVANIVHAMKEFAHPTRNEYSPADINHALKTTLLVTANEYKYIATMKTEFAELPLVTCNIGELNQVFLNLIVNGAHAIHDAGKDTLGGQMSVTTAVVADNVEVTFTDNGCGIPQENLDKIYDPFFTTKEVGRGTGQGLALTRSIVMEKHGGDIRVHSTVGVGTQFTLCLRINGPTA